MTLGEQAKGAHDLPRRAEAALEAVAGDEGRLERMQGVAIGEALDGGDFGAVEAGGKGKTGIDAPPIDEHGAGTALAPVTALLRARQVKPLAKKVEQRHARVVERDAALLAVDGEADGECHGILHSVTVIYG
ncbi:hypothetical protein D3C72_1915140 [compost metagenome]